MTERDQYIQSQVGPLLRPGEQVLHTAYLVKQPGLFWQIFCMGGLLLFLMTKAYYGVLTNQRLILVRTKQGFWKPQMVNIGTEEYDATQMVKCSTSGIANNRSMTFQFRDGSKQTWRIAPWMKWVTGTKAFFEQVPNLVNSQQLASAGGGAGGYQGLPAAQAGYQALPSSGFAPGARVQVLWSDGNRYPATVVQAQGGQYLCAMQNGAQQWVPPSNVFPG